MAKPVRSFQLRYEKWLAAVNVRRGTDTPIPTVARGAREIAALLNVEPATISDLRNPRHRAFDARVAAAVTLDAHRRLVADSFELFSLALDRDADKHAAGRKNIRKRWKRKGARS